MTKYWTRAGGLPIVRGDYAEVKGYEIGLQKSANDGFNEQEVHRHGGRRSCLAVSRLRAGQLPLGNAVKF